MMQYRKIVLAGAMALVGISALSSCSKWEGETVESSYMLPLVPDPNYSFSRNGNSVDYKEAELLREPIDHIYNYYLVRARVERAERYQELRNYFENGLYGLKPADELSKSSTHLSDREALLTEIKGIFTTSAHLSGYSPTGSSSSLSRNQRAQQGIAGFVGNTIADDYVFFIDQKGLAVSEVFTGITMGAIYLDKILNVHLDSSLFSSEELRQEHEVLEVVRGHNYTALEHHWDLAYGYYQFWLPYVQSDGLPILRESRIKLYNAFATGRQALTEIRYDEMMAQIPIIRQELSRVVAVRAMNYLVGQTTLVNFDEDPTSAFRFISRAVGLLYALPFTLRADGTPYMTMAQAMSLRDELLVGTGLWDTARLLSGPEVVGSLRHVAAEIGKPFGLTLDSIKRSNG